MVIWEAMQIEYYNEYIFFDHVISTSFKIINLNEMRLILYLAAFHLKINR